MIYNKASFNHFGAIRSGKEVFYMKDKLLNVLLAPLAFVITAWKRMAVWLQVLFLGPTAKRAYRTLLAFGIVALVCFVIMLASPNGRKAIKVTGRDGGDFLVCAAGRNSVFGMGMKPAIYYTPSGDGAADDEMLDYAVSEVNEIEGYASKEDGKWRATRDICKEVPRNKFYRMLKVRRLFLNSLEDVSRNGEDFVLEKSFGRIVYRYYTYTDLEEGRVGI